MCVGKRGVRGGRSAFPLEHGIAGVEMGVVSTKTSCKWDDDKGAGGGCWVDFEIIPRSGRNANHVVYKGDLWKVAIERSTGIVANTLKVDDGAGIRGGDIEPEKDGFVHGDVWKLNGGEWRAYSCRVATQTAADGDACWMVVCRDFVSGGFEQETGDVFTICCDA